MVMYEELISYADLYDSASFEAKKMIVSQLIRRVEVYRGSGYGVPKRVSSDSTTTLTNC